MFVTWAPRNTAGVHKPNPHGTLRHTLHLLSNQRWSFPCACPIEMSWIDVKQAQLVASCVGNTAIVQQRSNSAAVGCTLTENWGNKTVSDAERHNTTKSTFATTKGLRVKTQYAYLFKATRTACVLFFAPTVALPCLTASMAYST